MENDQLVCREMKWGWTTKTGTLTVAESQNAKMFRSALAERRCLVPADGFYEWKDGKSAHPYRIVRPTRNLFWFAGLWQENEFMLLTSAAAGLVEFIYDREPDVIGNSRVDWWFTESVETICGEGGIADMGVSNVPLEAYPVTPEMTDSRFESPACIEPVAPSKDPIQHAIDDPDLRWRDVATPPSHPQYVTLLINDEKTVDGRWDGKAWRFMDEGKPLKWCPPTKFVHRLNAG